MTLIIFDCESYIYKACTACKIFKQCETDRFIFGEYYDIRKGLEYFNNEVQAIKDYIKSNDIILVVGDSNNWRKEYEPTYKSKRTPPPDIYYPLKQEILNQYEWVSLPNLEADDTCRIIYEDNKNYPCRKVLVSIDKDFKSFPCELYNPDKKAYTVVNKQEADYNLMKQVIMGDKADNYDGLPQYGEVTTTKFLDSEPRIWEDVRELFREKNKLDKFITNLNLSSMVSIDRYNFTTNNVRLIKDIKDIR